MHTALSLSLALCVSRAQDVPRGASFRCRAALVDVFAAVLHSFEAKRKTHYAVYSILADKRPTIHSEGGTGWRVRTGVVIAT